MAGSSEQDTENAGYTEDQKGLEWMFIHSYFFKVVFVPLMLFYMHEGCPVKFSRPKELNQKPLQY